MSSVTLSSASSISNFFVDLKRFVGETELETANLRSNLSKPPLSFEDGYANALLQRIHQQVQDLRDQLSAIKLGYGDGCSNSFVELVELAQQQYEKNEIGIQELERKLSHYGYKSSSNKLVAPNKSSYSKGNSSNDADAIDEGPSALSASNHNNILKQLPIAPPSPPSTNTSIPKSLQRMEAPRTPPALNVKLSAATLAALAKSDKDTDFHPSSTSVSSRLLFDSAPMSISSSSAYSSTLSTLDKQSQPSTTRLTRPLTMSSVTIEPPIPSSNTLPTPTTVSNIAKPMATPSSTTTSIATLMAPTTAAIPVPITEGTKSTAAIDSVPLKVEATPGVPSLPNTIVRDRKKDRKSSEERKKLKKKKRSQETLFPLMSELSESEYGTMPSYLTSQISLAITNRSIGLINDFVTDKRFEASMNEDMDEGAAERRSSGHSVSEAELKGIVKDLNSPSKLKALLLLLIKSNRMRSEVTTINNQSETLFFIV